MNNIPGNDVSRVSDSSQKQDGAEEKVSDFEKKLKQGKDAAVAKSASQASSPPENTDGSTAAKDDAGTTTRSRGRPRLPEGEGKVRISMMLDPATLNYLKSLGPGYQTLANAVLGETLPGKQLEQFTLDLAKEIREAKNA